jgi:O-acetylserine/cysteine efflux transporter
MAVLLALVATVLTSWLPISTKILVRDARPALVAWAINAASLPLLAVGTLVLTRGALPRIDGLFVVALLVSAILNWGATILSTRALAQADASLVSPLLTFNPAFTLGVAWLILGERPGIREALGVAVILVGAYLLDIEGISGDALAPLRALVRRPGTMLAVVASALWGVTTVLEKVAIEHATPPSGPLVALAGTLITVLLLTPGAVAARKDSGKRGLMTHPRALGGAIIIAGIAPLFGFSAIALGFVGYVTALFKLSAVLTLLWARLVLHEGSLHQRLVGTAVMLIGGALVAL